MTYIAEQLVAHSDRVLRLPAIALENFAIVIRSRGELFEDCEAYQILHKDSGRHVATFSIVDSAIKCFQELEKVAKSCGKLKFPIPRSDAILLRQVVTIARIAERQHSEYWDDDVCF